ncbi:unnamed protein product [Rotaria sp. Silwood1]|nr:unnamed protein product [Rotaria sp. Silwood1]
MVFSLYSLIEAAFLCVNTIAILNEQVSFKIQHNSGVGYVDEYQNTGEELIRVHRELQCCSGCNCFGSRESCMQQVTVECPPGFIIGTVQQEY